MAGLLASAEPLQKITHTTGFVTKVLGRCEHVVTMRCSCRVCTNGNSAVFGVGWTLSRKQPRYRKPRDAKARIRIYLWRRVFRRFRRGCPAYFARASKCGELFTDSIYKDDVGVTASHHTSDEPRASYGCWLLLIVPLDARARERKRKRKSKREGGRGNNKERRREETAESEEAFQCTRNRRYTGVKRPPCLSRMSALF